MAYGDLVDWPTTDDLIARLNLPAKAEPDEEAVAFALGAAVDQIASKCALAFKDDEDNPTQIPQAVRLAILMQAFRWYRRKDTPEGVAGSNEQGTVYISRTDPDVLVMIGPYIDWSVG